MPQLKPEGAPSPCPSPATGVRSYLSLQCALTGLAGHGWGPVRLLLLPAPSQLSSPGGGPGWPEMTLNCNTCTSIPFQGLPYLWGSQLPKLNLSPWQRKLGVLTTGPPGDSLITAFGLGSF